MLLAGTGVELIMVERALRERGCLDEREVCVCGCDTWACNELMERGRGRGVGAMWVMVVYK